MHTKPIKVLIITYYWPPSGGSGVQRWLKFVKYLRDFDVEPIVYTVKNANYAIEDGSLESEIPKGVEVLKQPIFEPNDILSFFKKGSTKTSAGFLDSNPSFTGKVMRYVRANYFIPDARKFWIKPSVKFLKKYLSENKVDVVISSGPPHSLHLIGLALKKQLGIKWISDFRDPWTDIDYFHQLPLTKAAKNKHAELEREVLKYSDRVLVIGQTMKNKFDPFNKFVSVITNGFDSDFDSDKVMPKLDNKFSITHIGLMNSDRNPKVLWEVLLEIARENKTFKEDLEIKLVGSIAEEVENELNRFDSSCVNKVGYVSHNEVKKFQESSQVLLLAVNNVPSAKGVITGKIFEYLQAKRPILAIGPVDGDLAGILNKTQAGNIIGFEDKEYLKHQVLKLYNQYKEGKLVVESKNIEQYHRKQLTKDLADLIKKI